MAVGMHAVASGQLGVCFEHGDVASTLERVPARPVEIQALSEERSLAAAGILQERGMQTRPMGRYGRMLQCKEARSDEVKLSDRPNTGDIPQHPLRRLLFQFMPILQVIQTLDRHMLRLDIIAGVTVGIMAIPQSMSYASIAGLPYEYGLYSACVPPLVYAFLGQSRQLAVGPVAMVSLLVEAGLANVLTEEECPESFMNGALIEGVHQSELCRGEYAKLAIMTAALVGVLQIAARVLRLQFLVSFLGHPVTSGFTSAAAIIIGFSQLKYILGYKLAKSEYFVVTLGNLFANIGDTNYVTLVLGVAWVVFFILCKRLARRGGKFAMVGPLAPLVGCIIGSLLILACAPLRERFGVSYVGDIPSGPFPVSIHHWDFHYLPRLLPTALSACLIGYMESIAIGKNLAAKHDYEIDAGQELFALGLANVVGAAFSCYPVTGSFSRSAVSNATGAKTQLAGLTTSIVMLCTMLFLTPLFYYMPNFVLAAIVISSVIPLVAYEEAIKLWRIKKQDFILWVTAFMGTLLFGVLFGIAIAVALSLMIVISESLRPQITILWRIPGTTIYRPIKQENNGTFVPNVFIARIGSSMYFANASFIKDVLMAYVADLEEVNRTEYIVLEMTPVVSVDSTAVHVLQDVVNAFRTRGVHIAFAMVGNRVEKTIRKAKLNDFIGDQWFFPTVNEAVLFCLRHQQAKREVGASSDMGADMSNPEVGLKPVRPGDEIGFSNDLHHACTAIFVNLIRDAPTSAFRIMAVLGKHQLTVRRAHIEAMDEDHVVGVAPVLAPAGAKHTYFVRSTRHPGKLLDWETAALRDDLLEAISTNGGAGGGGDASAVPAWEMHEARIKALERALVAEHSGQQRIVDRLATCAERMEAAPHQDHALRPVLEDAADAEGFAVDLSSASSSAPAVAGQVVGAGLVDPEAQRPVGESVRLRTAVM